MIRNRPIDLLCKESREEQHLQTILEQFNIENRNVQSPIETLHTPTALSELLSDNPTLLTSTQIPTDNEPPPFLEEVIIGFPKFVGK
ncbi:hypothetical protein [Virgibacillus ainsalahensis]